MPRPPKHAAIENMPVAIKAAARQQMACHGTAGLTLRGVARELDLTAPAIYNYFSRLEDLITALIVDAFNALGDHVAHAAEQTDDPVANLRAGMLAYHEWAITHPTDFQLIYGNPIPGYHAPPEVTVPLARRPLETFGRLMFVAERAGQIQVPAAYHSLPEPVAAHLGTWLVEQDIPMSMPLFYVMMMYWTRIHGMTLLEIFGHTHSALGDAAAAYVAEVDVMLANLRPNAP